MNDSKKKLYTALSLAIVLVLFLTQIPSAYSAELTAQENFVSIITDVVGLDMTKYNAELSYYSADRSDNYGGLVEETVQYTLESAERKTQAAFRFVNKNLVRFDLYTLDGSPLPPLSDQQLPTNILDATDVILQRLQAYSGATYIQDMRNMLGTATELISMNKTTGNLKCLTQVNGKYTALTWMYTSNGVEYPKIVGVYFEDGALMGFSDRWGLYTIGSDEVKISREEAIRIAQEQAETVKTVTIARGDNEYEKVTLNLSGQVNAEITGVIREPLTLHPFWLVELRTDKPYYGITKIQVGIWADTGEIEYCHTTGFYGDAGATPSPQPTEAPTPPPENGISPTSMYVVGSIAAATIAIISIAAFRKKSSR
mgnify:CR=1 FL=1